MAYKLISVVVPMYFEEGTAKECYERLTKVLSVIAYDYEIIFVNDGSTDRTLPILEEIAEKDFKIKIISFSRNFGHQIAVTAGIDKSAGDAVIIIDADLQDPPELIPDMLKLWEEGYHVVYAKRRKREGETWFKLITAKLFYRFMAAMSDVKIPVDTGDFRLIDKKIAEVLKNIPERNRFLRGIISWAGFKQIPIEYERKERFAGQTKYPLKKMIKFAADGVVSFSWKPLKISGYLGILCLFSGAAVIFYSIIIELIGNTASHFIWIFLTGIMLFLGGIQLVSISILGEYIGRIYDESKNRPLYIIEKEINTITGKDNKK